MGGGIRIAIPMMGWGIGVPDPKDRHAPHPLIRSVYMCMWLCSLLSYGESLQCPCVLGMDGSTVICIRPWTLPYIITPPCDISQQARTQRGTLHSKVSSSSLPFSLFSKILGGWIDSFSIGHYGWPLPFSQTLYRNDHAPYPLFHGPVKKTCLT